jgi:hypothetical protein
MTSQGSAHARFQLAVKRGHLLHAEIASRELGTLSNQKRCLFCLLYEREGDPRFERAFRRWLRRARVDHGLTHEQTELLRAAAGAFRSPFRALALSVLIETCRELGLPPPMIMS